MDLFSQGDSYNVSLSSSSKLSPTISIDTNYQRITLQGLMIDPSGRINISMDPALGAFSMSTLGNLKPGTLQLLMTTLDPASGTSSTFKSLDLMLRPDDSVSMDIAGDFGQAGSPSLAVSRKNGGKQEMSLQTISRNVPAKIPTDLTNDMPKIAEADNLTSSNNMTASRVPESIPSSGGDMSGSGMSTPSIPSSTGMPGMGTPTFP
jgi:hypothetical protein